MPSPGEVALFPFPHTDLARGKLRPCLLLGKLPGDYDDWLICMLSTQLRHYVSGFDEIIQPADADYETSGLKSASVVRVGRLAVVDEALLLGATGKIGSERLQRIKIRLVDWLRDSEAGNST